MAHKQNHSFKRFNSRGLALVCAISFLVAAAPGIAAQSEDTYASRRAKALALMADNKMMDALPLLEQLHGENPHDVPVLEKLSFATLAHAASLPDEAARKQERAKARKLGEEAKAAGDNSDLLKIILETPVDGGVEPPASNALVQAMMRDGEAAFVKGDFDSALDLYAQALAIDPKLYEAPLFTGDVYYKKKDYDQASQWFARAVAIDPNRETAYRYWGDNLGAQGRWKEAEEQYISGVIAEPYKERSWMGLKNLATRARLTLGHPRIVPPAQTDDKAQAVAAADPSKPASEVKKDGTDAWVRYTVVRTSWHDEKFRKQFPQEKEYRHSLSEEVEALQAVADQVKEGLKKNEIQQLDPGLASLVKLSDQGLLQAYVLFARPDKGISFDYVAYRDGNREKLHQYIAEWMFHAQGKPAAAQ
jgi:tetratricopeptide (TPR) repeat protein